MGNLQTCPAYRSEFIYEDDNMYNCPECAHERPKGETAETGADEPVIKDAGDNVLKDGGSVTVIKGLKVKGSSSALKVGPKVKNIRLVEGDHDIDCEIDGIAAMMVKSEFVRKR